MKSGYQPDFMKIVLSLIFTSEFSIQLMADNSVYDFMNLGIYKVGYSDTIIYDTDYQYADYGYKGNKPFFIQIWHPVQVAETSPFMVFGDFLTNKPELQLSAVVEELIAQYRAMLIRDAVVLNLATGDSNEFQNFSFEEILSLLENTETRSIKKKVISGSGFPVIVYHHGSQSAPFENYLMAEYFASHGFMFLAASFHLPFSNTIFGLKPYDKLINGEEEQALKFVIEIAASLTSGSDIFVAGKSWGAQIGWRALDGMSLVRGFISLETTLEFKNDYIDIKEYWPEMWQKLAVESPEYPFPVMLCAATGKEEEFPLFSKVKAQHLLFVPTHERFEHNAYTSVFYLRYFLDRSIEQSDLPQLEDRLRIYSQHLELMKNFLNDILSGRTGKGKRVKFIGNI